MVEDKNDGGRGKQVSFIIELNYYNYKYFDLT